MYLHWLEVQLCPELERLTEEYNTWWSFPPTSELADYIRSQLGDYYLQKYFTSNELLRGLDSIAVKNCMYLPGNENIMILNGPLFHCFETEVVYKKNLLDHCRPHLCRPNLDTMEQLNLKHINNELYVETSTDLITQDPTSLFWLHPSFTSIVNQRKKDLYTWSELCTYFYNFIHTDKENIIPMDGEIFSFKKDSRLAQAFQFSHFHKDQIPDILTKITRLISKTSNLLTLCEHVNFDPSVDNRTISFIEECIQHNNMTPFIPTIIYI